MAAFRALGLDAQFGAPDPRAMHAHADKAFGLACSLLDLSAETCRWPVGEPDAADFVFCGAAPFQRYPYCLAHCLIAYRPDSGETESPRVETPAGADRGMERAA
jgi:GcrA cell cycle regulator